jgi:hypothetical protein
MNKYSNLGQGYGGYGQQVDLNDGMADMEYGEGIDYYDEEDGSGDTDFFA